MDENLSIGLFISSDRIYLKELPAFKIGLKIQNRNKETVHFDIAKTELFVNNVKNLAWDLAVHNGTIINLKIRSEHSKIVQWPLGEALFSKAGIYQLRLEWKDYVQEQDILVIE